MRVDLVVDGMIATTHIVDRLLATAFSSVRTIAADDLRANRPDADLLVISRLCNPRLGWLPDYLAERRQPYVYFLDDNLLELTETQDVANAAYYGHPAVRATLLKFLRHAAAVWVMSPGLRAYLRDRLALDSVRYLPAPVDVELFARPPGGDAGRATQTVIGYPTSRRLNVAALLTEIVQLAQRKFGDRVRFEFVGWCPDALLDSPIVSRVAHIPVYADFARFVATRSWTAALAPVSDSLFENCKTSVKYREYAAARLPGIYSDTALYNVDVVHERSGLLVANDAASWLAAIERLVDDEALRQHIIANAYQDIVERHEQGAVARHTRDALIAYARSAQPTHESGGAG